MRIALLVVGALLVADAAFAACAGSWNLGAALPAILGLPLLAIGLFYEPMQALFATGAGRVLKWLLVGGYAAFFAVFAAASVCIASYSARPPQPGADAVIVLGCALRGRRGLRGMLTPVPVGRTQAGPSAGLVMPLLVAHPLLSRAAAGQRSNRALGALSACTGRRAAYHAGEGQRLRAGSRFAGGGGLQRRKRLLRLAGGQRLRRLA